MAVFKDCVQTLPKVLLKWWLSWKPREKTREKIANLQRLEKKRTRKDCRQRLLIKILWKSLNIFFLSGRRDRTCGFDNPLVTSCVSDAQNCGKMQILDLPERPFHHFVRVGRSKLWSNADLSRRLATLSSLRARRTFKTVVKCKFLTWTRDPFVTSCLSDAQNCGKLQILDLAEQPFRHFVHVGRSKLW